MRIITCPKENTMCPKKQKIPLCKVIDNGKKTVECVHYFGKKWGEGQPTTIVCDADKFNVDKVILFHQRIEEDK